MNIPELLLMLVGVAIIGLLAWASVADAGASRAAREARLTALTECVEKTDDTEWCVEHFGG